LSSASSRRNLVDLVHRGEINTDNINISGGGGNGSDVRDDNVNSALSPFLKLPPSDIIVKAFRMNRWSNDKNTQRYVLFVKLKKWGNRKNSGSLPYELIFVAHGLSYPVV